MKALKLFHWFRWLLAVALEIVAFLLGGINFIVTTMNSRAPGMTMFRLPLTIWGMFITAILQAFALPVLTAAGIPVEGVGILLGADTISDMFRTTTNVTGHLTVAVILARGETD